MMDQQPRQNPAPMPQAQPPAGHQPPSGEKQHGHGHGRVGRFFRGYLMVAGALATAYVLGMLLVRLFVEIYKWTTP